jgi:hypothetical protein
MIAPQPHTGGVSARPRCGWPAGRALAPDAGVDPQLIVEFSVGDDMPQRLSFEGLELLAGLHHKGRAWAGICHHPDDAPSAMPLAGILGVPAQR